MLPSKDISRVPFWLLRPKTTNNATDTHSCSSPLIRYFALVARAKTEIVSVGPEGGRVARSYAGAAVEMALPANAVRKRVKVGLQLLAVPQKVKIGA